MVESAQEVLFSEHMVHLSKLKLKDVRIDQNKRFISFLFNLKFIIGILLLTRVICSLSRSFMAKRLPSLSTNFTSP